MNELRKEYKREDLGKGERGKHFKAYQKHHNIVRLTPEVAKAFPTEKAVNDALASLIQAAN